MPLPFDDIRAFLTYLEENNELVRVKKEVDPILEVNAILDKLARTEGPAVLFEKVKGSQIPLFGNAFGTMKRLAWALGVPDSNDLQTQVNERVDRLFAVLAGEHKDDSLTPVDVDPSRSPCKEVMLTGDDINLDHFPLIKLWPQDGGKYITLPLVITRDPGTQALNVGIYRMMMLDKKRLCMHWLPVKHGARHYAKAEQMGRNLPVAVVVGADPALTFGGMLALQKGLDEFQMSGFLKNSAIKVTRAEDSDLPVPAGAEIVFEGIVKPGERAVEGPFGEFHGYYSPVKETPVFHIRKITMRKNPIWHAATTGKPPTEIHIFSKGAERVSTAMAKKVMPNIVDMNLTRESGSLYFMIISMRKTRPKEARELIQQMWAAKGQTTYVTNIVVVDHDVDVHNLKNVFWAISTHMRPERDVLVSEVGSADLEKPSTFPRGIGARMGLDATTKMYEEGLEREGPDRIIMDEAVMERVETYWETDGFKESYLRKNLKGMPGTFESIREFIDFLEEKGELVRLKREVDPVLEINAIIDKLARIGGPAVLFENVKGTTLPVLGNAFGTSQRISWAFGKENLIVELEEIIDSLLQGMKGENKDYFLGLKAKGLKAKFQSLFNILKSKDVRSALKDGRRIMSAIPVKVGRKKAPCKEIVLTGDDVDLNHFPLVKLWPKDGGKYFTLPLVITRDPENGTLNVGIYRMMMLDSKRMCMHWLPQKHGFMHFAKAEKQGRELPVAVVIGADPALTVGGALALAGNLDEFIVSGLLKGSPIKYTTAEDSDLWIPAGAEVVFEGVVKPGEREQEGPFGEFHGYYSPPKETSVFHIQKITMRKDPIFHISTTGRPVTEIHLIAHEIAKITGLASKTLIPAITGLNMGLLVSGFPYTIILSINKTRPYEAHELMHFLWAGAPQAAYMTNIIVVDADVDVYDLGEVIRAISLHFRPDQDLMITPKGMADMEKPCTYPRGVGAKMGIDATTKWESEGLRRPMPDPVVMDEAVSARIEKQWQEYGFK